MDPAILDDMKTYVQWTEADSALLHAAYDAVAPHVPRVVRRFYETLLADPKAAAVITGGPPQMERLRRTLTGWIDDLFHGSHDDAYFRRRCEVGRVHVRIGLPQRYVFTAMAVIRTELARVVGAARGIDRKATLESMHRLLDLETGIMSETYRAAMSERVRDAERQQVEHQLREAEHLATIGQLAASLAHEIKNPLAGISGAIQVIGQSMAPDNPHREVIGEILKQINRLDAAVKDLLIYSRPSPPRLERCDLGAVVQRTINLLRQEPDIRRVQVVFDDVPQGVDVWLDETQLQQVITNILLNAAQACTRGGQVRVHVESEDQRARVVVHDTGRGMADNVAARAFEPFFTTKAKGTGLGLPICKRIVEAHGGTIELASAPNEGTIVTLTFPRSSAPPRGAPAEQPD